MKTLDELNEKLETLEEKLDELQSELSSLEIDPEEYAEQYDEMLNESNGEFMGFEAARILKELDPIAYRCELLDYVDATHPIEGTQEYKELEEEIEEIENEMESIEEEIEMLEEEEENEE